MDHIIDGAIYTHQEAFDYLKNRTELLMKAATQQNQRINEIATLLNNVVEAINKAGETTKGRPKRGQIPPPKETTEE